MKTLFSFNMKMLSLFSMLLVTSMVAADNNSVTVKTTKATVFLNGAELTQTATLQLKKGQNEISLDGLSPQADQQSVAVSVTGNAFVAASQYAIDYMHLPQTNNTVQQLQDSLQAADKKVKTLQAAVQINKQMLDLLQKGVQHAVQTENQATTTDLIEKQLAYYQQRSQQLQDQQTDILNEQKAAEERLTAIKKQLQTEAQHLKKRSGILHLTIQSAAAATVTAEIRYFTSAALWMPFYDLHVTAVGQPIMLTLKAKVAQQTGIDWNDVQLTLSTGQPAQGHTLPELQPWRLYEQHAPRMYKANHAMATGVMMAAMHTDDAMEEMDLEEKAPEMTDFVQTTEQTLSSEYDITLPYTIPGNYKPQIVTLNEQTISDVAYLYQAVPKIDDRTYLTAAIDNWNQLNLLNANANIIVGNTYFGQTAINTSSTTDKLNIPLGDDKQIAIKRELLTEQSRRKTVGQNRQVSQTYRITVRNNKKQPVQLSLQEPYPVAAAKEISVELGEETTSYTVNDKQKGILTYDIELPAGETRQIIVSYTVKYPKDWQINL
ncbi:MAG: DUF4139 domain-containing protein [Paludibacteraceae bacterium]|nr:DUF4139 domain-containing protein [Paludibacteraceae bacterium]